MNVLSEQDIASFQREGFCVVRGFYGPAEIARITGWVDEVQAYADAPGKYQRYYEDSLAEAGVKLLNRMENFSPYHAGFAHLLREGALPRAMADLFGEPAVLFKEKINFKLPGGEGFKPHQDHQAGWWNYASLFISALICIDPATPENGCLEVAAGRHREGMFEEWTPLGDADLAGMAFQLCPTAPGDVVFFDSFTPHCSQRNLTDKPRRLMFITYNRASEGDHRVRYYADKRASYPQDCERTPDREYVYRV